MAPRIKYVPVPDPRFRIPLIHVWWFDASYQRGECSDEELNTKVEIESAGLLVREDKETVSLALDRYERDQVWRYIQPIPRVNILRMRKVAI
jgi:hypothetical protein